MRLCASSSAGAFKWACVNVLRGVGDAFSTGSVEAFQMAAMKNGIDICMIVTYEAGSTDMRTPIKDIIEKRCCLATVLFGSTQDISSLLLEAHKQNYAGEWIMSDNVMGALDGVISNLHNNNLDKPTIHKLLRGLFACILKE